MTTEAHAAERRRPPLIAVITLLTAVLTVFLIAFAWPSARSEPRNVPLAVAGPAPAVAQIEAGLEQAMPGGFEITAVPDRQAAVQRIEDRDVVRRDRARRGAARSTDRVRRRAGRRAGPDPAVGPDVPRRTRRR